MDKTISVEAFPPGEYIQDEMDAREWTQDDLAAVMGRTRQHINRLIKGQTAIGPESAIELAAAFGTSSQLWMNLQTSYELSKAKCEEEEIQQRAKLYSKVPVRQLQKRGWLSDSTLPGELDNECLRFFRMPTWDAIPDIQIAARKSTTYDVHTFAQLAWGCRARQLGMCVRAAKYVDGNFEPGVAALRKLIENPQDIRLVPSALAEMGVRLVIVQHLPETKIDGAAIWIDDDSPVVALSLRFGRIDNFWHNLFHELIHIKYREKPVIDVDLNGEDSSADGGESEKRANQEAANYLIPSEKLESFIARHDSLFYQAKIVQFAGARGVHPGIVVGQLQKRNKLKYNQHRSYLVDIRQYIHGQALTDGWGDCPTIE